MNMTRVPSIVQIEEKELQALVNQVEERLATGIIPPPFRRKRKFTAVDLWNCRKQNRTAGLLVR